MDPQTRSLDRAILAAIRRHSSKDAMPDREFGRLALRIFSHQYERNSFYRRLCDIENRNPGNVRHWKEIPAVPSLGFKELILTSFPVKKAVRCFRTSGTTHDARGSHFFETLALYDAAILGPFRRHLMPDRARIPMFFLMPSPQEVPDSSLSYMMGAVKKRFGSGPCRFYVKKGKVLSAALAQDLARARGPVMLLATAFSLKIFLDDLKRGKKALRLAPGSRLMETGGFKGKTKAVSKNELYREAKDRLGIAARFCVSEYGMTELTSQYYDTTLSDFLAKKNRRPAKSPAPWMRALVIDPRTGREAKRGRPGILRHYDLANRGSVLAVETEDLGRAVPGGIELLGRAPGAGARGCSLSYEALLRG